MPAEILVETLTVGSMFSGIGGLDLGLERAGMRVIWQAEVDPYASAVLAAHWPDVPNLGDVTLIDWSIVERPDLICGGFPCPPVSRAGLRRRQADPRWLWPEFARAVGELRPRCVLVENVPGLLDGGMGDVLGDLAQLGFDAEWSSVPACFLGAPHTRPRVFVVAHSPGADEPGEVPRHPRGPQDGWPEPRGSRGGPGADRWLPEPEMDRVAHGVPRRVVRPPLEALGNAVVPQVAEWIGRRIIGGGGNDGD